MKVGIIYTATTLESIEAINLEIRKNLANAQKAKEMRQRIHNLIGDNDIGYINMWTKWTVWT